VHAKKSGLPAELVPIDALVERWARWAKQQLAAIGWPAASMTQKMIEWHEIGLEPEHLYPSKGDKAPEGVMFIDRCVAQLPADLRKIAYTEYFPPWRHTTNEAKAKSLRIKISVYRERLKNLLWAIYGRLFQAAELA
jgi:hypothetical protein